jgi:hypothetical protein
MRSEVAGGRHRRPGWRPLVRLLLFLKATDCMLGLDAAASGGLEVTVAISEKVPKHLCKRALSNLEVRNKVTYNIRLAVLVNFFKYLLTKFNVMFCGLSRAFLFLKEEIKVCSLYYCELTYFTEGLHWSILHQKYKNCLLTTYFL